jgi:hypothetical protein
MKKLRLWLIRKLLQSDKLEQAVGNSTNNLYADMLKFIAEQMSKDYQKYSAEFMSQKFANVSAEFLSLAVKANTNLNESQKMQIVSVLTASDTRSKNYIG